MYVQRHWILSIKYYSLQFSLVVEDVVVVVVIVTPAKIVQMKKVGMMLERHPMNQLKEQSDFYHG